VAAAAGQAVDGAGDDDDNAEQEPGYNPVALGKQTCLGRGSREGFRHSPWCRSAELIE